MCLALSRYKTRAYRFWNKDKVEKRERREIEKQRVRAENEAKKAQEEADRKALADIDALQAKKVSKQPPCTFFVALLVCYERVISVGVLFLFEISFKLLCVCAPTNI